MNAPQQTADLWRILSLPRRTWGEGEALALAEAMTGILRTPAGTMKLRPLQAIALYEAGRTGGAFVPITVSAGKTLISLLAPTVLNSQRPLLIVPAKLVEKTKREWRTLSYHWQIRSHLRIVSYEIIPRVQSAKLLEDYRPDLIVCDESHKLKSPKTGTVRRIRHYLEHVNPTAKLIAMTGTTTKRSILDYAHILKWALKGKAPVPLHFSDLESWSLALDERKGPQADDPEAGALVRLATLEELSQGIQGIRQAYRRRLTETEGVITSKEASVPIPIVVDQITPEVPASVADALRQVRSSMTTPDGQEFADAISMWRHCRELALGFCYVWDPPPPQPWREARKVWAAWSRWIIDSARRVRVDTELQAVQAVDNGHFPEAVAALEMWRAIRPTFTPRTVPIWIDDFVIQAILEEVEQNPTLIWTEHEAFAVRLSQASGWPFYSSKGLDRKGRNILDHHPRQGPAICSIRSIGEGFNLQTFHRNLFTSIPTNGPQWEQTLGRTHRTGQESDQIDVTCVITCSEHERALIQSIRDARYIQSTTGQEQKILIADFSFPVDTD